MAPPVKGRWIRLRTIPYADASKWGTGIDPIHEQYGSDALRVYGRLGHRPDITPPFAASPDFIEQHAPWGYQPDDIAGLDVFANPEEATRGQNYTQDDWPSWDESTPETRAKGPSESYRPWGSSRAYLTYLRSLMAGPMNGKFKESNKLPTETVSEGWLNKPTGRPADSEPSDDKQIFIQTSDAQRYQTRNNSAAVNRHTDEARSEIPSRVVGQKLKVYSGEERHYDMFPFQQKDIIRPFWYRTAGVGNAEEMVPNAMTVVTPLQRTPPPDPTTGQPEIDLSLGSYGYTNEDQGYY